MARRWSTWAVRKAPLAKVARRATRPFRRRTPPGAPPGTLRVDPQAAPPVITAIAYGPNAAELHETDVDDLDVLPGLVEQHPVTWVNIDGLGDAAVIERIGEIFGLHPLALEDVIHVHQRSKVEDYEDNLFVVARMAQWEAGDGPTDDGLPMLEPTVRRNGAPHDRRPESEQVSLFLGRNFVVTFQEHSGPDSFERVRTRIRRRRGRIRELGADFLAYSLLDGIIDGFFPVIEEIGIRLDQLDDDVLTGYSRDHLRRLHRLRGDLLILRKNLWPQREAIHDLIREAHPFVSDETHLFLRDCYDHTAQLLDVVETYREMCADLREYHYAKVTTRTNEVMKVLTIISTIFIPLSFVAGVYGMNFDPDVSPWNMPELRSRYGYPATLACMAAIGLGLVGWMWRKGWLQREEG